MDKVIYTLSFRRLEKFAVYFSTRIPQTAKCFFYYNIFLSICQMFQVWMYSVPVICQKPLDIIMCVMYNK